MKSVANMFRMFTLVAAICLPAVANAYYIQPFNGNNAAFTTSTLNGGTPTEVPAPWSSDGGNTNGNIFAGVDSSASKRYAFANYPATAIYGDLNGAYLTVDFKTDGIINSANPLVRFYVGNYSNLKNNYFVSNDSYAWNPNNDTSWTTHFAKVVSSNFIEWPNQSAGTMNFNQVMANYQDIGLVFTNGTGGFGNDNLGFSSSQGATIKVDNFGSSATPVPLPPSVLLFGTGLIGMGLVGLRRRIS